jgi:hypothetical protein
MMSVLLEAPEPADIPPLVEERLYSAFLCLSCLKRLALLAVTEREEMPLVSDVSSFGYTARRFAAAAERHLYAVKAVLPFASTQLPAPTITRRRRS